jgi:proliferating cell nuclear antigen
VDVAPSPSGLNWIHKEDGIATFEERYFLRYLTKFARGGVDPTVQLFLKQEYPLILRYQLTIGSLRFCVAPIRA